jgi:predicted transposase YbfD/YdcC
VESARIVGGQASTECRHYLSSLTGLERFADVVRGRWAIENGQHWASPNDGYRFELVFGKLST